MKKISVLLISTLFIASCVKEELKQDALVESYKINATVEDFSSDTKAAVSDDGVFTWQANDQIRIIKNSESMVSSPLSVGGSKDAVFEFASSIDGYNMGFFPSDIEYNGKVTLPAERVWQEDNATPVMKASLENGVFNFKHIGGVVRVQIQNVPTAARKFVFHAKGHQINGTFTNGESLETNKTEDINAQKYTLTFDAPQPNTTMNFYVPLPVGVYELGFKISLMDSSDKEIFNKDGNTKQPVAQQQLLLMKPIILSGASGEGTNTTVDSAEEVNSAMEESTNVTVSTIAPSEGSTTVSIELPKKDASAAEATHYLKIGSIAENTDTIEIVEDETDNAGESISALIVNVPTTEDAKKLVIDMPNTTVTIAVNGESVTFEEVEATTAENTLVVKGGVTINTLTVHAGNVIVQEGATIKNVTKGENNNQDTYVILMSGATAPVTVGEGINVVSNGEYALINVAANGGKVTLESDVTLTSPLEINNDVTLDLGSKTLTANQSGIIVKNGTFTIKNGNLSAINTGCDAISIQGSDNATIVVNVENNATITAGDCCIVVPNSNKSENITVNTAGTLEAKGTYNAVQFNGNAKTSNLNVTGGEITSTDGDAAGIYYPCNGTLSISGGTITGSTAVYVKSGNLKITGGTLVGNGTQKDYEYFGNGCHTTGDALVIDNCNYPYPLGTLSVSNGTFISHNAKAVGSYSHGDGTEVKAGFITGGIFSTDPSEYVAEGYEASKDDDNWRVVKEIVKVGNAEDLKNALNSLVAGNMVVLEKDIDLTGQEWIVSSPWQGSSTEVIFNGNNHKIIGLSTTGLQGGLFGKYNSNGNITIKNLILEDVTIKGTDVDGESAGGALIGWIENHGAGTITIENVKVEGIKAEGFKYIGGLIGYNNGDVAMNLVGCSVTGKDDSYLNSTYNENGNYKGHVGGLLGLWMNGSLSNCEVKDIAIKHGTNDMTGSSNRAGALVGTKYAKVTVNSATVNNVTVDGAGTTAASLFGPDASSATDTDKNNVTIVSQQ